MVRLGKAQRLGVHLRMEFEHATRLNRQRAFVWAAVGMPSASGSTCALAPNPVLNQWRVKTGAHTGHASANHSILKATAFADAKGL